MEYSKTDVRAVLAIAGALGGLAFLCMYTLSSHDKTALGAIIAITITIFRDYFDHKRREDEEDNRRRREV